MKIEPPKVPVAYSKCSVNLRRAVRTEYIRLQEGKCYHCGGDIRETPPPEIMEKSINTTLFPGGFFSHPIHLHHDHITDMTIGAVHARCNAVLWQYHNQ